MIGWLCANGQYPAGQVPLLLGPGLVCPVAIATKLMISSIEMILFMTSVYFTPHERFELSSQENPAARRREIRAPQIYVISFRDEI